MKSQKLFSLDNNLIEQLQKCENASKIVNDLLIDYFAVGSHMNKEKIMSEMNKKKGEIIKIQSQIDSLRGTLDKIKKREDLIKKIFKDIPDEVLEDFKQFGEKINYENRYTQVWRLKYDNLSMEKIKKAYDEYFKTEEAPSKDN